VLAKVGSSEMHQRNSIFWLLDVSVIMMLRCRPRLKGPLTMVFGQLYIKFDLKSGRTTR
jgi:hypothetical protein